MTNQDETTVPETTPPPTGTPDPGADAPPTGDVDQRPADGAELRPQPPLRQGLEALLFLADEPLDLATLADALEVEEQVAQTAVEELAAEYERNQRGMEIRSAAGGWRMYSADGARPVLERWALVGRSGRLTQAALETLAVIAYKQPISRQDIGDIRGVNADGAVRSLVARGYVQEVGRDDGPGQAVLYGTTHAFLERLGLSSLDDLPPLTDYLPEAPAPDEPALGALKEIRRRLASGEDLATGGLRRRPEDADEGPADEDPDDHDHHLPPPGEPSGPHDEGEMDDLTDKLERAARSAVDRLRQAVAAEQSATEAPATTDDDPGTDADTPDRTTDEDPHG